MDVLIKFELIVEHIIPHCGELLEPEAKPLFGFKVFILFGDHKLTLFEIIIFKVRFPFSMFSILLKG
jgi:hypothetical protein